MAPRKWVMVLCSGLLLSGLLCCGGVMVIGALVEQAEKAGREMESWPLGSVALFAGAFIALIAVIPATVVTFYRERRSRIGS
ncbi:hypothetical protein AB0J72_00015 [Dactylosporangium sp. NPDC049742]|uniref:hypothetical protein n=1 Tax=Dactylosporangium sp. NPDC049742 TaxID=3154737 RepID=UPI003441BD99